MTIPISFSSSMLFTLFTGFTVFTSFTVSRFYLLHYFHNFSHILERTHFPSVLDIFLCFSFHKLLWLTSLCLSYQVSELVVYCGNMLTQRSLSTIKVYLMISWGLTDQLFSWFTQMYFFYFPSASQLLRYGPKLDDFLCCFRELFCFHTAQPHNSCSKLN